MLVYMPYPIPSIAREALWLVGYQFTPQASALIIGRRGAVLRWRARVHQLFDFALSTTVLLGDPGNLPRPVRASYSR